DSNVPADGLGSPIQSASTAVRLPNACTSLGTHSEGSKTGCAGAEEGGGSGMEGAAAALDSAASSVCTQTSCCGCDSVCSGCGSASTLGSALKCHTRLPGRIARDGIATSGVCGLIYNRTLTNIPRTSAVGLAACASAVWSAANCCGASTSIVTGTVRLRLSRPMPL